MSRGLGDVYKRQNCENFTSVLSSFENASTKLILLDLLSLGEIVSIKQARRLASSSFIIKVSYYLSDPADFFRGQAVAGNLENNFSFSFRFSVLSGRYKISVRFIHGFTVPFIISRTRVKEQFRKRGSLLYSDPAVM